MSYSEDLLVKLKSMLAWKKSKKFYAEKLQITEDEVNDLLKDIKKENKDPLEEFTKESSKFEELEFVKKVNKEKGTIESTVTLDFEPKSEIDLAALHKIDLSKYIITNYWSKLLPS